MSIVGQQDNGDRRSNTSIKVIMRREDGIWNKNRLLKPNPT